MISGTCNPRVPSMNIILYALLELVLPDLGWLAKCWEVFQLD
jgi:hypothetical protein